tara:strand:- start:32983 stop:34185 length:1203 start_codon:yes stop_codon:yes gene_type:complete
MMLHRRQLILSVAAASLLAACGESHGLDHPDEAVEVPEPEALAAAVELARAETGLAGLAVLVGQSGEILEGAAAGLRARGQDASVTIRDRWHIGSCTKSMTATLLARYVERGLVSWDSTVAEMLPELAAGMDSQAATITLTHLLTATAGLPEYPSFAESEEQLVADIMQIASDAPTVAAQRLLVAERMLSRPPLTVPGAEFVYCSTGFIIAGAIAERLGGESYETLLAQEVLSPLGITEFGFGAPGSDAVLDQPRGHLDSDPDTAVLPSSSNADNPAYFAPAGGLNITLGDWAVYAFEHARGETGDGQLLSPETYTQLHTPAIEGGIYAFGWGVLVQDGSHLLLTHNGSNGAWFADLRIYPQSGFVYLMASNDGREELVKQAFRSVRTNLDTRLAPLPAD